jgi:hypothetical protein
MLQLHHGFILEMKMRNEKMEIRSVKVKNMTLKIVMMGVEFCNHSEISKVILIWWRMNEI